MPCPVGFTLSITADRLNSTLLIRSSDVFVGLPYDVMGHALLMQAIMSSLNISRVGRGDAPLRLGEMQVSLAHPHLYEVHREMADCALSASPSDETIIMPDWGVKRITGFPDAYVSTVAILADNVRVLPEYSCRPEVVA